MGFVCFVACFRGGTRFLCPVSCVVLGKMTFCVGVGIVGFSHSFVGFLSFVSSDIA